MALTVEKCRQLFVERDGALYWAKGYGHARLWDKPAGCLSKDGHLYVTVDGNRKFVSHVVWARHYGHFPKHQLQHVDGDRQNNSIENLQPLKHRVAVIRHVSPGATWFRRAIRSVPLSVRDDPRALAEHLHNEMMHWSKQ